MTGAEAHLLVVHVPVVGSIIAVAALIAAHVASSRPLLLFAYGLLIVSGIAAGVAYYSGPPAAELLKTEYNLSEQDRIEDHAVIGRAAFVGSIVLAVAVINALLQHAQSGMTPRWLHIVILGSALVMSGLFAWSAHEGGEIRHPEVRELF